MQSIVPGFQKSGLRCSFPPHANRGRETPSIPPIRSRGGQRGGYLMKIGEVRHSCLTTRRSLHRLCTDRSVYAPLPAGVSMLPSSLKIAYAPLQIPTSPTQPSSANHDQPLRSAASINHSPARNHRTQLCERQLVLCRTPALPLIVPTSHKRST